MMEDLAAMHQKQAVADLRQQDLLQPQASSALKAILNWLLFPWMQGSRYVRPVETDEKYSTGVCPQANVDIEMAKWYFAMSGTEFFN